MSSLADIVATSQRVGATSRRTAKIAAIAAQLQTLTAEEIEIANPKHKMIDYKGLGMAGTAELWAGVEKLESKIKWASFDAETLTMSASPFQTHSFQARGNLEQYTSQGRSAELAVVYMMTGVFKDAGSPSFRQHQMVETTSLVSELIWIFI